MTTTANSLATLHRLHLALQEVRDQLDRGPRQIRARDHLCRQARTDAESRREQLKTLRVAGDRKSLDLKSNEAKIEDLQGKLNVAASNREYDVIRGQIDADTMANSVLQDEILELLEKVDRAESEIAESERETVRLEEELQKFRTRFESDAVEWNARAERLTGEIKEAESGLTGDLAERYRRLVEAHGADAMAPVEDGVCRNCHVHLTPQSCVLLNAGKVVFCGSCGRLLYLAPT